MPNLVNLALWLACRLVSHVLCGSSTTFNVLAICLILTVVQLMLPSDKHFARNAWSCSLNRNMFLDGMLKVDYEQLHRANCFWT